MTRQHLCVNNQPESTTTFVMLCWLEQPYQNGWVSIMSIHQTAANPRYFMLGSVVESVQDFVCQCPSDMCHLGQYDWNICNSIEMLSR